MRVALLVLSLVGAASLAAGCLDTEFVAIERPPAPLRPIGDACTVDAECADGRCVGGACSDDGCDSDEDCRNNEICVRFGEGRGTCELTDDFACQTDQRPILSLTTQSVTFSQVPLGTSETQTVTVSNEGDCLLTLQVISFSENSSRDFACSPCSAESFPQRVPPRRSLDVSVTYTPTTPGEAVGDLLIRSDDVTAGDAGLVSVDLFAEYDGIPSLVVRPQELNFGFVPFTAGAGGGSSSTKTVVVTNEGTGSAVLEIERIGMDEDDEFRVIAIRQGPNPVTPEAIDPDAPLLIPPFSVDNPLSVVEIDVQFTPDDNRDFDDELQLRAAGFGADQRVGVPCAGSSLGPPQIEVPTVELLYGGPGNAALTLGTVDFKQITVRNNGQSELVINYQVIGGEIAGDFTVSPSFVPPIPAGGSVLLSVFYSPSAATDAVTPFSPQTSGVASLQITSNDTDPGTDVSKVVPLRGFARSGVQNQALKVEMEFENADNSWAGSDFRNVDLILDSQAGEICRKPQINDAAGNGVDFCALWSQGGDIGTASWLPLGQFEEPERVVVRFADQSTASGQSFDVKVDYVEDCANIPSGLLSSILGITGSVLLGALGGSIGVPIAVDPGTIADTIANNCFDHASTQVTVRISLDGQVVATPGTRLGRKGDQATLASLRRVNGAFCSLTPGVGAADLQCQ